MYSNTDTYWGTFLARYILTLFSFDWHTFLCWNPLAVLLRHLLATFSWDLISDNRIFIIVQNIVNRGINCMFIKSNLYMYISNTCLQLYLGIWLHSSRGTFPQILLGACLHAVSAIWRQLGTAIWRQTSFGTDWQSFFPPDSEPSYSAWPPAAAALPYSPWHSLTYCVSHLFSYSVEQRSW